MNQGTPTARAAKMSRKKSNDSADSNTPKTSKTKQPAPRTDWLDDTSDAPLIHQHVQRLESFLEAMADGIVSDQELHAQEARLVEVMKRVEPKLKGAIHEDVTNLLCELSAYNIMHTVHEVMSKMARAKFQG
jgi:hypothetical protein